jgi:hypothetical protein
LNERVSLRKRIARKSSRISIGATGLIATAPPPVLEVFPPDW